ncbi:type IV pilus assembly protein PilB [Candidatus Mycosynbacter amalyticus]|uniref:Type IV pilus assembly protein PilB n=1 Tax=Candidatus Mycosynbacter amalyticus TaxID=2665156 RepID=A0A857MPH7_9BACT|nr:GspE/PulE family protein [Candidatus Mycosynbacter amalyticus]QHN43149.1 type IV pilus assembly protein PilB [Candidatus Mycosynbacter amalyticus]
MRISDKTFLAMVGMGDTLTQEQMDTLKQESAKTHMPMQSLATKKEMLTDEAITRLFSEYTQIPYAEIDPKKIPEAALKKIPERIARQYNAIIFQIDDDGLIHLAMEDPDDVEAINFLQKQIGTNTKLYVSPHDVILSALDAYRGDVNKELGEVISIQSEDTKNEAVREEDVAEDSPIAKTVNLLLEYAIRSGASDIHIEPREEYIQVRYRVDGVLKEVNRLPKNIANALVSRVKILSNLKIDERRVPQDGRFKIHLGGRQFAFRVSTLPITDGEKIVMRVLNESNEALPLEKLGYWGKSLEVINNALEEPNGMILVTGPTGSGKSTSLFSVLSRMNTPDVNISTIEDPVEYKIPGVNQTQTNVKAGMTFASGLRALLRQDPNIIMVGEIRDGETANLGVQAALTGHLVFSTLHTNNAATCLPRLLDMGIEPFLIASTVKAVVGQRLVRRLRYQTREQYEPTEEEKKYVTSLFHLREGQTFAHIHELEKQAAAMGIGGDAPLATDEHGIKLLWRNNTDDNDDGAHSGFKGRVGIYEVLGISVPIQKMITGNATSNDIQDAAIGEGMTTMQTDGLIKALRGETTVEEVLRVTKE